MSETPYETSDETLTPGELIGALSEHLIELRKRLVIAFIALIIAVIVTMFLAEPIMTFLCRPIGGMENLRSIDVTENAASVFKVAALAGFVLALPVIIYELLAFIIPALKPNEKHWLFVFLPLLVGFFLLGVCFAFFILLPAAIPFLTGFMGIRTEIRPENYISFVTSILFWIGVVFEMPIGIYVAAKLGIVNSKMLLKNWRQAIVVCSIIAMVITPTVDPINMLLLMVPLIALFFLSILFAKFAEKKN